MPGGQPQAQRRQVQRRQVLRPLPHRRRARLPTYTPRPATKTTAATLSASPSIFTGPQLRLSPSAIATDHSHDAPTLKNPHSAVINFPRRCCKAPPSSYSRLVLPAEESKGNEELCSVRGRGASAGMLQQQPHFPFRMRLFSRNGTFASGPEQMSTFSPHVPWCLLPPPGLST